MSAAQSSASSSSSAPGWVYVGPNLGAPATKLDDSCPTNRAATAAQLAALTALPAGMVTASLRRANGLKKKGQKHKVVPDGKIIAKMFNPVAGRPYPAITNLEQKITVTLYLSVGGLATSTTVPVYGNNAFSLSQSPAAAAYTSLFDQYKIEQLEAWVEPLQDTTAVACTTFASCIDLDDANTPTSFGQVADHQGALVGTSITGRYHRWKPHVAIAAYSGAFTSFSNEPAPWIDVASPAVQHYGLKMASGGPDGVARAMTLTVRATISFRAPSIA